MLTSSSTICPSTTTFTNSLPTSKCVDTVTLCLSSDRTSVQKSPIYSHPHAHHSWQPTRYFNEILMTLVYASTARREWLARKSTSFWNALQPLMSHWIWSSSSPPFSMTPANQIGAPWPPTNKPPLSWATPRLHSPKNFITCGCNQPSLPSLITYLTWKSSHITCHNLLGMNY